VTSHGYRELRRLVEAREAISDTTQRFEELPLSIMLRYVALAIREKLKKKLRLLSPRKRPLGETL
jgi:hypothetical protein